MAAEIQWDRSPVEARRSPEVARRDMRLMGKSLEQVAPFPEREGMEG